MKHVLRIEFFKSGTGFVAKCSCGKNIQRSTGCNRSGMDYGAVAAREAFAKHIAGEPFCVESESTREWISGLAGNKHDIQVSSTVT